jgi:hypothetical protein
LAPIFGLGLSEWQLVFCNNLLQLKSQFHFWFIVKAFLKQYKS